MMNGVCVKAEDTQYEEKVRRAMMCMTRQCWEDGIVAQALMETGQKQLYDLVVYDMVLRQSQDGRLCNVENTPAVTDSSFCIPAVWQAGTDKDSIAGRSCAQAAQKNVHFLLEDAERTKDGVLFHMIHTAQIWADSAAFLPYSLALTGHEDEAWLQMKGITGRLYDPDSRLYFHMWDDEKQEFIRPLPWGVGNGWILTGLLRMILVWTGSRETKAQMEDMFRQLLERMLQLETADHLFHDILTDPDTYEESETAAMTAYAIYRAVPAGLADASLLARADKIRDAVHRRTRENGLVMGAASSPAFDRPGTSAECQAHVLMMEEARRKCGSVQIP